MIPIRDDNPTLRTPIVTWALIALNAAVWVLVQGMGAEQPLVRSICELGLIPAEFLGRVPAGTEVALGEGATCVLGEGQAWFTPLSSMFMHGGWMHIIGNMWFLHIFGNNVEDSMGHGRFVVFYLLCGLAAAMAQTVFDPGSQIPMVGASGAIGGVMGAYVVLYPRVQIHMLIPVFVILTRIVVPAFFMLGYWFVIQLVSGWASMNRSGGGTAFWAHIGGFAAGAVLIFLFRDRGLVAEHRAHLTNWQTGHFRESRPY
ncbi:MAG: rhomboid family intramembrane serine protease [Gemmatimonadales bacterium]|jgi:membrane associated rhomboid family serine protease|nr:rhomboid family intramembrane serine protease [Gemmatimonadales bacterium]